MTKNNIFESSAWRPQSIGEILYGFSMNSKEAWVCGLRERFNFPKGLIEEEACPIEAVKITNHKSHLKISHKSTRHPS